MFSVCEFFNSEKNLTTGTVQIPGFHAGFLDSPKMAATMAVAEVSGNPDLAAQFAGADKVRVDGTVFCIRGDVLPVMQNDAETGLAEFIDNYNNSCRFLAIS